MSRLARDGTAEPVSRDQTLRHERGQGSIHFLCSADHEQDWQPYPVDPYSCYMCYHTYILHYTTLLTLHYLHYPTYTTLLTLPYLHYTTYTTLLTLPYLHYPTYTTLLTLHYRVLVLIVSRAVYCSNACHY